MIVSFSLSALILLASVGPTITELDEHRFRVGIIFDDTGSAKAHVNAQIALMRAASKHCKGKGTAVSDGTLFVDKAEPLRRGKEAMDLSEVYTCKAKD